MASTWAATAYNEAVSFNALSDATLTGVFVALNGIPASNEEITKDEASLYVGINTSHPPFAAKTGNQLVVKSDLVSNTYTPPSFQYTGYFYFNQDNKGNYGWWDATEACSYWSLGTYVSIGWDLYLGVYTVIKIPCASSGGHYVIRYDDPLQGTLTYCVTLTYITYDSASGLCEYSISNIGLC